MNESNKGFEQESAIQPDTPSQGGNNHLLLISIDTYKNLPRLHNAVKDAKDFKKLLLTKYQFEKEKIYELFNKRATYNNIDKEFKRLAQDISPGDNLVIYFSGHGYYDKEWAEEGYWIPYEARENIIRDYYPYKNVLTAIKNIATQHTFVIADSCYSGSVFVSEMREINEPTPLEKDPSRWLFASGRNQQVSDGEPGKNSPFALELLDVLARYGDEGISVEELVAKVSKSFNNNQGPKQQPLGRALQGVGDKGGLFYFHPSTKKSRPDIEPIENSPPENEVYSMKELKEVFLLFFGQKRGQLKEKFPVLSKYKWRYILGIILLLVSFVTSINWNSRKTAVYTGQILGCNSITRVWIYNPDDPEEIVETKTDVNGHFTLKPSFQLPKTAVDIYYGNETDSCLERQIVYGKGTIKIGLAKQACCPPEQIPPN